MTNKDFVLDIMRRNGAADAAALRAEAANLDGTAIIAHEGAVPDFETGKDYTGWPVGAPVADEGQVWTLLQPYNSADHPGHPAELRALWGLCHTRDPARAKPWADPYGTSGLYYMDECYEDKAGVVHQCAVDATDHDAEAYPAGWRTIEI